MVLGGKALVIQLSHEGATPSGTTTLQAIAGDGLGVNTRSSNAWDLPALVSEGQVGWVPAPKAG